MWKISQKGVGAQPRWRPTLVSQNLSCCASRSVAAPCVLTGRYGAKSIKGKRFTIRNRREPKISPGSLPTHEALPRADPRSLASAPEALWGPCSGALGSPQRSWGLVSASPDTYRGVLWSAGGSSLLHSALLARIRLPLRWSREKIDAKGCDRWPGALQGGVGLYCG